MPEPENFERKTQGSEHLLSANHMLQENSFAPDAENQRQLRDALGRFGTGVTVITAPGTEGPEAITVNSFSSVSLDPPLVLWCIERNSNRYQLFKNAKHYSIHVLGAEQATLCMEVARNPQHLHNADLRKNNYGVPVLDECLVRFDCTSETMHDAGDHVILVARVRKVYTFDETSPLAFYRGRTGTFAAACNTA